MHIDIAMRTADRAKAREEFVAFLLELGLDIGRTIEVSGYEKSEVNSRVFGTAAIYAPDFDAVAARLRRVDAAIFDGTPARPSRYFKLLRGQPQGLEIVGPSPDDPIAHPELVWINIEAEDGDAWQERLGALHDNDGSSDRDEHFPR